MSRAIVVQKSSDKRYFLYFLVGLTAFVVYANSLGHQFTLDDPFFFTQNKTVLKGAAGIPQLFAEGSMQGLTGEGGVQPYRPVTLASFALQKDFFGVKPYLPHLVNVLLYLAVCLLFFSAFRRIFREADPRLVFAMALLNVFVGNLTPVFGCNEATAANFSASVNVNNGTCDYSCGTGYKRVLIDIFHDSYPGETSWTLKNASTGATLASGTTSSSVCVANGTCMVFRMNDTAGDGIWHHTYGYGQYFLCYDGALIKQGGVFGSFEETTFNCPQGFACSTAVPLTLATLTGTYPQTLATATTTMLEEWYTFTPPQTGQYQITTCGRNTCDTRLWVYDMACGSIVLSSGVEGATFADDNDGGCGIQAVVNANMPGGTLHRLRVGHNTATAGCGSAITFSAIKRARFLALLPYSDQHRV